MDDGAKRWRRDHLALKVPHARDRRVLANDQVRARIILGLDPLPGHGHDIDPGKYGLDEIRRRRWRKVELAPERSRQHGQILRH